MVRRSAEMYVSCHISGVAVCLSKKHQYSLNSEYDIDHLSPRRSTTYACTPPGILTSTRTSTRENALKQLPDKFSFDHGIDRYIVIPVTAIPHFPCSRF